MIKQRAFQDPDTNLKIKTDLWNAAIGSILRYGITTLTTGKNRPNNTTLRNKMPT